MVVKIVCEWESSDMPTEENRLVKSPVEIAEIDVSRNAFQTFVAGISRKEIRRMGQTVGMVLYFLDMRHRRIVRRNLKFAYPEWEWSKVLRVTRRVYQNFGITAMEIIQFSCSTREEIQARGFTVEGKENLEYFSNKNGVILLSAHLGNWEFAAQYMTGFIRAHFVGVGRKIRFKPFERWVNGLRTRFGGELIDKKGAMPEMRKALRQGKVLGVLLDQAGEGATVKFFDRDVKAHAGVTLLALRSRSPVIPTFCVRDENGYRIILEPPLDLQRTSDLRSDIHNNTQLMVDAIEKAIRAYPDQWFWFHKRWKAYYPHLYREDMKRAKRKEDKRFKKMLSTQQ